MRRFITILFIGLLATIAAQGQISIGGNVYGGGNAGDMTGNTKVSIHAGDINGVFGGARMANVSGNAFVNIDGEHASNNIFINNVYGGNDIAGTIGAGEDIPDELTEVLEGEETVETHPAKNAIDNSWSAFIRTSPTPLAANRLSLVVGSLFGGGNGDYYYAKEVADTPEEGKTTHYIYRNKEDADADDAAVASDPSAERTRYITMKVTNTGEVGFTKPELSKTYLEILGGCIAHLYGGGNNATVTENTTICINNNSPVLTETNVWPTLPESPTDDDITTYKAELAALAKKVGLSTYQSDLSSYAFNFARVFGGNNKAPMAIRPKWNLQAGTIRDIYSGGNQGAMTYERGILLPIDPVQSNALKIENVFGGCRIADVNPDKHHIPEEVIDGTVYPEGYAARVLIKGGDITNVYGGNDISGNIYGGNAVGIHSSIKGDVYGGGNGSYAYTDNEDLGKLKEFQDFYYPIPDGKTSVEALNAFRPNAEAVSIRVIGTETKKTVIGGAIYCGGNSATLSNSDPSKHATSQLKIGSYVIADKVFLGNNGANMVTDEMLEQYAGSMTVNDSENSSHTYDFSQMDLASELKDANGQTQFDKYMDGCAMMIEPEVVFDNIGEYQPYSTYFGSFYCGGNVGSMKIDGVMNVSFNDKVVIFDKVVGGSNEANVYEKNKTINGVETKLNAQYLGGLLGDPDGDGNKLILNFGGLKIQPKRWKIQRDANYAPILDANGNEQYALDSNGNRQLEWNTVDSRTYKATAPVTTGETPENSTDDDLYRRFYGGNVYGGCYSNGHVNGNVIINLNASLEDRKGDNAIFDQVEEVEGEAKLYGADSYKIIQRNTGVLISQQGMDPLGRALNVFGGGYGGDSEIWGSATINLNKGYTFQIFGGGEQGAIGKAISHAPDPNDPTRHNLEYEYDEKYSTYINLKDMDNHPGTYRGDIDDRDNVVDYEDMAEAEFIYGGAFEGSIAGSTHINLGNGRIFNSFAGSCNADILGHTETYVGRNSNSDEDLGFPWIRDHIYGGNDLGGRILGNGGESGNDCNFKHRVSSDILGQVYGYRAPGTNDDEDPGNTNPKVLTASAYTEYIQGRVEYIFGGCYGDYDYRESHYEKYAYTTGSAGTTDANLGTMRTDYHKPWMANAFVNFKPNSTARNAVARIYGAGQGHAYLHVSDAERDKMQDRSYVLIDVPQTLTNFTTMEVFGAGDYSGVGMRNEEATTRISGETTIEIVPAHNPTIAQTNADGVTASAVIDLVRGQIGAAYGGSFQQGVTRRTIVNVPEESTIQIGCIFGGAYGSNPYLPCDVYEAHVNYLTQSEDAYLIYNPLSKLTKGAIYGGNNYARRTLYGKINIEAPVRQKHHQYGMTNATVYGAGCGSLTWNEYTEVNLKNGAKVWEVYGGGEAGGVMSAESAQKYISVTKPDWPTEKDTDPKVQLTDAEWINAWSLGGGYDATTFADGYVNNNYAANTYTNLSNPLVREAEIDDRADIASTDTKHYKRYNTNVIINKGAYVGNYAYGGGLGNEEDIFVGSGDVYGTTYIALLGGTVNKDLYAAGTSGSVYNIFRADFTASANAYIKGGTARNVYGGGWKGSVGYHVGGLDADYYNSSTGELLDIPGETHVVIGVLKDNLPTAIPEGETADYFFYNGIPAVERNAYGGGEGGAVWGTANITMNNGYIGYRYHTANESGWADVAATANIDERYEEKIVDETYKDDDGHFQDNKRLDDAGCIFGGGYIDNSSVDFTHVKMYGGHVRNALFGGGEIAAIGRGIITETKVEGKAVRSLQGIYRPGKTHLQLFDGHVHRNVFGGGRGYNNLGESGKLFSDGYVFGQTSVYIHGGEIGTDKELIAGNGNVFGGGDIGYVYSAYEYEDAQGHKLPRKGVKDGVRFDGDGMYQGYYYEHDWSDNGNFIKYLSGAENASGNERKLTEDCKVVVEPYCKAKTNVSYTIKYNKGQVVSDNNLEYLQSINSSLLTGSIIDAYGKVTADGGISFDRSFTAGQYVPTSALNTLGSKTDSKWDELYANTNDDGIIIHNAVFAGGNTSSRGSDQEAAYANTTSVYGNVTASIHDVYHRDLITIGTGHIGGLYGDGNLTLVDGYRGLNITNYGTDYHYLYEEKKWNELTIGQYNNLLDREKDYYELRYKCIQKCTDDDGTIYYPKDANHTNASTLTRDDILTLFAKQPGMFTTDGDLNTIPNPAYWEQNGVCSIYAGRILNTIQRADFCGVFGSRMVMQGAQDRVPEVVDYTKYTINRVREVSLNKKMSVTPSDPVGSFHGNYFGIYSVVNYLGALTSDFDFGDQGTDTDAHDAAGKYTDNNGKDQPYTGDVETGDKRTSDNINTGTYGPQYENQTFYGWKRFHHGDRERNNGNSHNKVALASGVYLEITTEESTGKDLYEKVWGPITGVVELDLINVQQGMGGGFVYAKNIHGKRHKTDRTNTTLTALNAGAATRWDYTYDEPSTTSDAADLNQRDWQTSGNFVHSTQTIIDDCYNVSNRYKGPNRVPAHYWYIRGSVYVYDQYISAYTGATNAYSEMVDLPLTITAASHGTMKLLNVQPNRYAYYNTNGAKLSGDQKLIINDVEYKLNDPISYWDWYKLTSAERGLFEPVTYVSIAKYKYNETADNEFPADAVLLPADYETIKTNAHHKVDNEGHEVTDENNNPILQLWDVENGKYVLADSIIRLSNNLSHDTGYILTYKVNNPTDWDTWYTEYRDNSNNDAVVREKNQNQNALAVEYDERNHSQKGPNEGPTYRLKNSDGELLGQRAYKISDLISKDVKTTYDAIPTGQIPTTGQATFVPAYVATAETDIQRGESGQQQTVHLHKGATMSATEASGVSNVAEALICTKTIKLDGTDNIYINSVMTEAERNTHLDNVKSAITTLVTAINTVLTANEIENIDANAISNINTLTPAQLNKITPLQKKELSDLLTRKKDIINNIVPAYYCTVPGLYGGDYYASGINYRGLEAWSSMSEDDRKKFIFNYDALDLLTDPNYSGTEGEKYQYDGATYDSVNDKINPFSTEAQAQTNPAGYSLEKPVDYTATYNGSTNDKTDGDGKQYLETTVVTSGKVYIGDELTREQFESLPNYQRHYTPLTVTATDVANDKTCTFYVVNTPLMIGPTPYTVGNIISEDDYQELVAKDELLEEGKPKEQDKVTKLTYTKSGTYYFCRENYENDSIGTVITSTDYEDLTNLQKGFTIHGIAPTEVSTLYVSRFSDINDLSTEKIITVIYEYNYEESDVSGLHITPVTERHVLNIHINFKTGAPIVEDISAPEIILPGHLLSLLPPNVIEGASPIQGGGWELYKTESDADNHNGVEYIPDIDQLYWYQNGYWLRYYALSHIGGKTYSNKVQVSVANYHDLKDVMDDKSHHYYVDNPEVKRDPKIYINDSENGVDQLKSLFDLSMLTETPTGDLEGHALLNERVQACQNLEFFMRTNVNHTGDWTPIANGSLECFEGTLHGDGYTVSGLNNSLFGHLCGSVYNLGVTGSFTSAGVADTGKGYVENCWINTTGTPDGSVYAVFGDPTAGDGVKQIVNSYYQEGKNYKTAPDNHGLAKAKPEAAFYNGEVAYDLNGFYLFKRYWDHDNASGDGYTEYKYYTDVTDPTTGRLVPQTEYYGSNITYCSSGYKYDDDDNSSTPLVAIRYVEDRYADGDFRFAAGEIQLTDERLYQDNGQTKFYPIWPDDYLFFGQTLTYGWDESRPHQDVPSHQEKDDYGRLLATDMSNRVYRAPAYYRSKNMGVVHYNPWATLAAYSAPKTASDTNLKPAYPNMTAVDFAGHNDKPWSLGPEGESSTFYPPLLDDDGLIGIANRGETPNLLVYAPSATDNQPTYDVLNGYFIGTSPNRTEPVYSEYTESSDKYDDGKDYGRVYTASTSTIHGHLVQSNLKTTTDHLLVDKEEFNCPIGYDMGNGYRMWYQRIPANFVDRSTGWEGISLPFTVEIVTTQDKGELTHFYQSSKKGHEYWLRGYAGNVKDTDEASVKKADFNSMDAGSHTKNYTNTFLWDYYYSKDGYQDKNTDLYQKQYYSSAYLSSLYPVSNYPYAQAGTPYLVGFPGATYYEFDLSGEWTPQNRYQDKTIASPGKQTVTFVSEPGTTIGVSDNEMGGENAGSAFTFKPNYLKETLKAVPAGTLSDLPRCYYLNDVGNAFVDDGEGDITVWPFRPYLEYTTGGRVKKQNVVRRIIFAQDEDNIIFDENDPRQEEVGGELRIYVKDIVIGVTSTLRHDTDVLIFNTSGQIIGSFTIHSGETIETPVPNTGVYIVRAARGKYNKKVSVK